MASVEHYDAIVIGAGQGGGPISTALAKAGKKTAIIEREHVGGTCINEGCTQPKLWSPAPVLPILHSAPTTTACVPAGQHGHEEGSPAQA